MRIGAALRGDLKKIMEQELADVRGAVTKGVREASEGLKNQLRQQVISAGLGQRLANAWRASVYPKGRQSRGAAGLVYTRAPEVMGAHDRGVTIRSANGFWLAIPTAAAPKRGTDGERINPSNFPEVSLGRLRFVHRKGKPGLLVVDGVKVGRSGRVRSGQRRSRDGHAYTPLRGTATVVMFILVPQVSLRSKLDVDGAANRWHARLPALIVRNFPSR